LAGAVTATAARAHLPALASALLALLALAAGLMAFLPERVASAPVLGLSVLSLPLLASLQFYAGYPLRVLTAEASRWLLALQHEVVRSGASLVVNGQLVMVDAPCSGVQMVWLGYFTACTVGLYAGHGSRRFLARLPAVGALVLLGNVLRNTVLVAAQAAGTPLTGWAHEGVGLLVLAGVCAGIAWVMGRTASGVPAQAARRPRITNRPGLPLFDNRFVNRVLHKSLWAVLLPLCALGGVAQALAPLPPQTTTPASTELPAQWNGAPLRPLALTEVEQRFARQFPGTVARLTDGQQVLVWRTVRQPTRMLHPASDCYRGLGWRIHGEQLEAVAGQARWRCFIAERGGRQLRVCEQIEDAQGQTFTDASAWYWAALAGQSSGPWRAVTVARAL
jgi:exosortase/archaeosortase family protein